MIFWNLYFAFSAQVKWGARVNGLNGKNRGMGVNNEQVLNYIMVHRNIWRAGVGVGVLLTTDPAIGGSQEKRHPQK